ncbi:DUF6299 family protein [Streptoverticillium reticulum]|uniref:DUF6299 family protein n=1 Tax=Streptoverticillium reticulum TaxID=1433415 RepID=UPI0039BF82B8
MRAFRLIGPLVAVPLIALGAIAAAPAGARQQPTPQISVNDAATLNDDGSVQVSGSYSCTGPGTARVSVTVLQGPNNSAENTIVVRCPANRVRYDFAANVASGAQFHTGTAVASGTLVEFSNAGVPVGGAVTGHAINIQ